MMPDRYTTIIKMIIILPKKSKFTLNFARKGV